MLIEKRNFKYMSYYFLSYLFNVVVFIILQ